MRCYPIRPPLRTRCSGWLARTGSVDMRIAVEIAGRARWWLLQRGECGCACMQAGMEPDEPSPAGDGGAGPSTVVTATGVELSAADRALLEDDDDDVDLDALEQQVHAGS